MVKFAKSIEPGGGGSPSGIAIAGTNLIVAIDCGGVRRLTISPSLGSSWKTDKLPHETLEYKK